MLRDIRQDRSEQTINPVSFASATSKIGCDISKLYRRHVGERKNVDTRTRLGEKYLRRMVGAMMRDYSKVETTVHWRAQRKSCSQEPFRLCDI